MAGRVASAGRSGFSLVEILVSIAIVAVLMSLLLPMLSHAREVSRTTVCASNLRQIGMAWQAYFHEFDQFPRHTEQPDWRYGGAMFVGADRRAILDPERPINRPLAEQGLGDRGDLTALFRCPGDKGVFARDGGDPRGRVSVLAGRTCFGTFGTSYRANLFLMDSTHAGIDPTARPLRLSEVHVGASLLLLTADPAWWYATRPAGDPDADFEASWHGRRDGGNMLAIDGSVRFTDFAAERDGRPRQFALLPRP
jgi:prepilin-type N-terminal cleavage/methylation domain-containing protein